MSSKPSSAGWSFAPHQRRAEITDILRREFEARAYAGQDSEYDPRPVSALHAALNQALALDDASKEAVRPILGNRGVAELLRERWEKRDDGDADSGGDDRP